MVVFLFSLIGVPPTAGFMGKWYLFLGVVDQARAGSEMAAWYYSLVFAAAINTAISAYYYLKVAKEMYLVDSEDGKAISIGTLGKLIVAAMAALTFYLCIAANQVFERTQDIDIH
jgi:NADH-quinone oxidoreductase subunit N